MKSEGPFPGRIPSGHSFSQCLLTISVSGKQLSSNENAEQGPFPLNLGTSPAEQGKWSGSCGRSPQSCQVWAVLAKGTSLPGGPVLSEAGQSS